MNMPRASRRIAKLPTFRNRREPLIVGGFLRALLAALMLFSVLSTRDSPAEAFDAEDWAWAGAHYCFAGTWSNGAGPVTTSIQNWKDAAGMSLGAPTTTCHPDDIQIWWVGDLGGALGHWDSGCGQVGCIRFAFANGPGEDAYPLPWSFDDSVGAFEYHFRSVAAHEVGHSFGLDHPEDGTNSGENYHWMSWDGKTPVMKAGQGDGPDDVREVSQDDVGAAFWARKRQWIPLPGMNDPKYWKDENGDIEKCDPVSSRTPPYTRSCLSWDGSGQSKASLTMRMTTHGRSYKVTPEVVVKWRQAGNGSGERIEIRLWTRPVAQGEDWRQAVNSPYKCPADNSTAPGAWNTCKRTFAFASGAFTVEDVRVVIWNNTGGTIRLDSVQALEPEAPRRDPAGSPGDQNYECDEDLCEPEYALNLTSPAGGSTVSRSMWVTGTAVDGDPSESAWVTVEALGPSPTPETRASGFSEWYAPLSFSRGGWYTIVARLRAGTVGTVLASRSTGVFVPYVYELSIASPVEGSTTSRSPTVSGTAFTDDPAAQNAVVTLEAQGPKSLPERPVSGFSPWSADLTFSQGGWYAFVARLRSGPGGVIRRSVTRNVFVPYIYEIEITSPVEGARLNPEPAKVWGNAYTDDPASQSITVALSGSSPQTVPYGEEWSQEVDFDKPPGPYTLTAQLLVDDLVKATKSVGILIRGWSSWEVQEAIAEPGLAATSWAAGRIDLFNRQSATLRHRAYECWWPTYTSTCPMSSSPNWANRGAPEPDLWPRRIDSDPAGVAWTEDSGVQRIGVFAVGPDGALWQKAYASDLPYSPPDPPGWGGLADNWTRIGAPPLVEALPVEQWLTGTPAVARWRGETQVFVRGSNANLWHYAFHDTAAPIWHDHGGNLKSDPTAVGSGESVAAGGRRFDVFAVGADDALWHQYIDEAVDSTEPSPWRSLGGILHSAPVAASWVNGRLDVFGLGLDNAMYHISYDEALGAAWRGWGKLGGSFSGNPAAVSWGPERIDVFARDAITGKVWHRFCDSNASNPGCPDPPLGQPMAGDPEAGQAIRFVAAGSVSHPLSYRLRVGHPDGLRSGDVMLAFIILNAALDEWPDGWIPVPTNNIGVAVEDERHCQEDEVAHAVGGVTAWWRSVADIGSEPDAYEFPATAGTVVAYRGVDPLTPIHAAGGLVTCESEWIDAPTVPSLPGSRLVFMGWTSDGYPVLPPMGMIERASFAGSGGPWAGDQGGALIADEPWFARTATGQRAGVAPLDDNDNLAQLIALTPLVQSQL